MGVGAAIIVGGVGWYLYVRHKKNMLELAKKRELEAPKIDFPHQYAELLSTSDEEKNFVKKFMKETKYFEKLDDNTDYSPH
ncbi:MAG: hypothetical protein LE168_01705 [Endomicrobium sp.]|nr:hypothetical protein [Endomicrobium sp.]